MKKQRRDAKQQKEGDIKKPHPTVRLASTMARAGRGQLPAKDSLEGV